MPGGGCHAVEFHTYFMCSSVSQTFIHQMSAFSIKIGNLEAQNWPQ